MAQAEQNALTTNCLRYLKQWGIIWYAYADDFNGSSSQGSAVTYERGEWANEYADFMGPCFFPAWMP